MNKFDNSEQIKKFLEKYSLPRLNQEQTTNLNKLIPSSEIKFVIFKKPRKQKSRVGQLHRVILFRIL